MSEFWLRKMKTYFKRIDLDGDGSITREDFKAMADRFAQKSCVGGADVLEKRITAVYDEYLGVLGSKKVGQEEFIATMQKHIDNTDLDAKLRAPLPLLFTAVDTDSDGQISKDEFRVFFDIMGIDNKFSATTFEAIDTNNDGQLSQDEFVTAGMDFFKNQNESPNQAFWGPLEG